MSDDSLRQDWSSAPEVQRKILDRLYAYLNLDCEEGATARDRTVIQAARAIASFSNVSLKQQALDLAREKFAGRHPATTPLADLVEEAEKRATLRLLERSEQPPKEAS